VLPALRLWKAVCGSDLSAIDPSDFDAVRRFVAASTLRAPSEIVDTRTRGAGIDLRYYLFGNRPKGTSRGLAVAEAGLERLFNDRITVEASVSFMNMAPGVLGFAFIDVVIMSYADSRNGLQADADIDDVIAWFFPAGATVRVRRDGNSDEITDGDSIYWTVDNFRAVLGPMHSIIQAIVLSRQVRWDVDPTDGVPVSDFSLADVVAHETIHQMGFVSGVDDALCGGRFCMSTLDLLRFQSTDGCCDYNPDTYTDFALAPRLVAYNSPDDQHILDLIAVEYGMSDGDPFQGSHFRSQVPPIGLMDPERSPGQTNYPNLLWLPDIRALDAVGYDFVYVDSDGDGVCDALDRCPGADDSVDLDGNGVPDACDCPGDADGDGQVGLNDLTVVLRQQGQVGMAFPADFDGDGRVDLNDLTILLEHFGASCAS